MTQVVRRLPRVSEHTLRLRPPLSSFHAVVRPTATSLTAQSGFLTPVRSLSTSHPTSSSPRPRSKTGEVSELIFSAGQPDDLPHRLSKLSSWSIASSNKGITRLFIFPTFNAAWRFMNTVAEECKVKRHHPFWSNLYNEVTIEWTTHKPPGLSIKDIEMAEFCDQTADDIGLKVRKSKAETPEQG